MSILGALGIFLGVMVAWLAAGVLVALILGLLIKASQVPIHPKHRSEHIARVTDIHTHTHSKENKHVR